MKKMFAILAAGSALVATPALACQFTGSASIEVGTLVGSAAGDAVPVPVLLQTFRLAKPGEKTIEATFADAGCTWDAVAAEVARLNPTPVIARTERFRYPSLLPRAAATQAPAPAPSAAVAPAPVAATPAPVATPSQAAVTPAAAATPIQSVAPAAAPAPRPLPPTVDLSGLWSAIETLQSNEASIRAEIAQVPQNQLTPDQLALVSQLNSIPDLVTKLQNLPKDGQVLTSSLPAEEQRAIQQVEVTESMVESYLGRDFLDFSALFGALGVILIGFLGYRLRRRVTILETDGVTHTVEDPRYDSLSGEVTALQARLTTTEGDVSTLKSRHKHKVERILDGSDKTLAPAEMKALADGTTFDYVLKADDELVCFTATVVDHTAAGEARIKLVELPKPIVAKALFGEVADFIEQGGTPTKLKAVNA